MYTVNTNETHAVAKSKSVQVESLLQKYGCMTVSALVKLTGMSMKTCDELMHRMLKKSRVVRYEFKSSDHVALALYCIPGRPAVIPFVINGRVVLLDVCTIYKTACELMREHARGNVYTLKPDRMVEKLGLPSNIWTKSIITIIVKTLFGDVRITPKMCNDGCPNIHQRQSDQTELTSQKRSKRRVEERMSLVTFHLPSSMLDDIRRLVMLGKYGSVSEVVRDAIQKMLDRYMNRTHEDGDDTDDSHYVEELLREYASPVRPVSVTVPKEMFEHINRLVELGRYGSKSELTTHAIARLLAYYRRS